MDNIKLSKMNKAISMFSIFFSIFKSSAEKYNKNGSEEELQKTVDLLVTQYRSLRYTLEDLGCNFDETGKIRGLNNEILSLEKKLNDKNKDIINSEAISIFIRNMAMESETKLKNDYGLSLSININASSSFTIKTGYLCIEKGKMSSLIKDFCKNDQDFEEKNAIAKSLNKKALSFFDVDKSKNIIYNEKNVKNLKKAVTSVFSEYGNISHFEVNIKRFYKDEDFHIDAFNFTLISLPSFKNFSL